MSLDGVFDATTMDQWFNPYHSDSRGKYIQDVIANCDTMLYGRYSYEMLYGYWSFMKNNEMGVADKLNKVKKYVVSANLPQAKWENSTIIKTDVMKSIAALKQGTGGNILVLGSAQLVKGLLEAGLIDELKVLITPHIMGSADGRLFDGMQGALELESIQQLDKGVITASYKPVLSH